MSPSVQTVRVSLRDTTLWTVYIGRLVSLPDHFDGVGRNGEFGNYSGGLVDYQQSFLHRVEHDLDFRAAVEGLRGQTLACFCRPTEPCHGDVILAYLNRQRMPYDPPTKGIFDALPEEWE